MRDPARIDRILNMLKRYWKTYPDLRLGQIVENAAHVGHAPGGGGPDTFYVEDDVIERGLAELERTP